MDISTLFIAEGEVRIVNVGYERETVDTRRFFHLVTADDARDAERKVRDHYQRKSEQSCGGSPYGTRYRLLDVNVWESLPSHDVVID
ncbi:hypothetical protein F6X40_10435 [Paraburkholderia sp. UCT31]|uniref:hypothetical protein n=1 Tax=Paraburkholderia sp. UCT31 TaxID=2615209 RepID=UPI0016557584|nr:hypothetical protein [Paraburkholderia sp. UCT31]MBC8737224.1 hypothetical protein [Paraburkholderia sp. UCT31]